jgi:hypothetical protein
MTAESPLSRLQAHVRYRLASRVELVKPWRMDELTRLVVWHWPHRHLEAALRSGSRHHKAVDHAMALVRAQVREQWEARHGVGPLWQALLAGTVDFTSLVILDLWLSDSRWRERLEEMREVG